MHPAIIGVGVALGAAGVAALLTTPKKAAVGVTPAGNTVNAVSTAPASISLPGVPMPPNVSSFTESVQKNGNAVPYAHNLFDYLKAHGYDASPKLATLVKDFQVNHNADKVARTLSGQLPEDGFYDQRTSAALTIYIGDVIPPDPKAPPIPTPTLGQVLTSTSPGAAATSGFNLYTFLKANAKLVNGQWDESGANQATLQTLVTQFQKDVNTDPVFPGPAYAPSPKPPIMIPKLDVTGSLGPASPASPTRRALNLNFPPGT